MEDVVVEVVWVFREGGVRSGPGDGPARCGGVRDRAILAGGAFVELVQIDAAALLFFEDFQPHFQLLNPAS